MPSQSAVLLLVLGVMGCGSVQQCGVALGSGAAAPPGGRGRLDCGPAASLRQRSPAAAGPAARLAQEPAASASGLTGAAEAAMRASALSSTLGLIEHIQHVANETFGNRTGQALTADAELAFEGDLRRLLNESETLQRELASRFLRQRHRTMLSEKTSNASDSLLRPLETMMRMAQAEVSGARQVGSGDAPAPASNTATLPILAPERHARDDVLAFKAIALLEYAAAALHDALRTLNTTRALRACTSQPAEDMASGTLCGASAENVAAALEADAAPALRAGDEGRRPLLATLVHHVSTETGCEPDAVWQQLEREAQRHDASPGHLSDTTQQRQGRGREQGAREASNGGVRAAERLLPPARLPTLLSADRLPSNVPAPRGVAALRGGGGGGSSWGRHGALAMRLSGGQGDGAGSGRSNPVAAFFGCDNDRRLSESTDESSDPWSWEARETAPLKDILPGIPDYNPDKVRTARELLGVDVLANTQYPTHPSETCEWYDELDPLPPDKPNAWINSDGTVHLPEPENMTHTPEYAAALAERAARNELIERNALQYMSRKMSTAERLCVKVPILKSPLYSGCI